MMIEKIAPNNQLCAWGCGKSAKFYSDTSDKPKWTCAPRWQLCPAAYKRGHKKFTDTMMARYGVPLAMKDPVKNEQRRQTNLKRYGVTEPQASKEIRQKYTDTMIARHGVMYPGQLPAVVAKANISRAQGDTQKIANERRLQTVRAKYGTDWPIQNSDVFQKNLDSCFKHKSVALPSGAVVFLQGYEPLVLAYLLKHNYSEYEFLWAGKPSFWYTDKLGRRRRYHPDFVLPHLKLIIEVKAKKWFERDADLIYRKARACMEAGWEVSFAVMGNNIRKRKENPIEFIPFRAISSPEGL